MSLSANSSDPTSASTTSNYTSSSLRTDNTTTAGYVPDLRVPNGSSGGNWISGTGAMGEMEYLDPRSQSYFYQQPHPHSQLPIRAQPFPPGSNPSNSLGGMNMSMNMDGNPISRGGSDHGSRRSVSRTNSGNESISGRGSGGNAEWKYEMRREAQEILPGLYLGPFQASTNLDKMRLMGITHILCVRDQKEARLIYPRFPTEFQYMTLDISDNTDQNLITLFPKCRDFIEEAMSMGGTVLAHCNGGIALSPAIVIGYLMWKFSWSAEQATAFVQNKRYCVSTMSFSNQFKEYEPIQLAQKMVQAAGGVSAPNGHKRHATDEDDSEDEYERNRKQPVRGASEAMDVSME
ncbi:hypothetical protein IAT40_006344 [Kwoniella sp. CBS 6097]